MKRQRPLVVSLHTDYSENPLPLEMKEPPHPSGALISVHWYAATCNDPRVIRERRQRCACAARRRQQWYSSLSELSRWSGFASCIPLICEFEVRNALSEVHLPFERRMCTAYGSESDLTTWADDGECGNWTVVQMPSAGPLVCSRSNASLTLSAYAIA